MTWEERVARLARQAAAFNDVGLDYRLVEVSAADLGRLIEERNANGAEPVIEFRLPDPVPCANCDPATMEANVAAVEARMSGPLFITHTPPPEQAHIPYVFGHAQPGRQSMSVHEYNRQVEQAADLQRWAAERAAAHDKMSGMAQLTPDEMDPDAS